jgi:hypothetical protein
MKKDLAIFEGHGIRRLYDETTETWWFSVVDIMQVLTQQPNYKVAQNYWKVLKHRLNKEGSQSVTNCNQLKLPAADGKNYLADVATAETLLRLVQSVPSPKGADSFGRVQPVFRGRFAGRAGRGGVGDAQQIHGGGAGFHHQRRHPPSRCCGAANQASFSGKGFLYHCRRWQNI